jgi:hypothetical protein
MAATPRAWEVRCGRQLLIFDGGTGLRQLGEHLKKRDPGRGQTILLYPQPSRTNIAEDSVLQRSLRADRTDSNVGRPILMAAPSRTLSRCHLLDDGRTAVPLFPIDIFTARDQLS